MSSVEQALAGREWEWEGDRSLREAQSSVVSIRACSRLYRITLSTCQMYNDNMGLHLQLSGFRRTFTHRERLNVTYLGSSCLPSSYALI